MSLDIGSTIGTYRLTGLIGQGGMGLVYVAEHTLIGKRAAVKVVRPELVAQEGVATRFINEARAVNTVEDDHVIDIFDAGQTPEGVVYCVMELLSGESLQDHLRSAGRLSLDVVFDLTLQIARALHSCHEKQIVHRDLKPANVFIVQKGGAPFVKILDFGVAKLIGQNSSATHSNAIIGTPFYMAPEQCRGSRDLDRRLDVYALGVILYELCTGSLPFEGNSVADIMIKQATETPIDPRVRAPELPEWLARVILTAMAKDRDGRFADMAAFAAAIEEHLPDRESAPARRSTPSRSDGPRASSASAVEVRAGQPASAHEATLEPAVAPAVARVNPGASSGSASAPTRRRGRSLVAAGVVLLASAVGIIASRFSSVATPDGAASAAPPIPPGVGESPRAAAAALPPPPPAEAEVAAAGNEPAAPAPIVRPVPPDVSKPEVTRPPSIAQPIEARPIEARPARPAPAASTASSITVSPAAAPSARPATPRQRANLETFFPP